jgi:hypothetical protein
MTIRTCLLAGAILAAAPSVSLGQAAEMSLPKISGRVFYNLSDKGDGAEFDIKRSYLTVDQRFNDTFSANLTTDFQYASPGGATDFFVKKAYLQAKVSEALTVRVGAADTPWVAYVDGLYGYRWIEKTLIDRTGFAYTADWGVHAQGVLPGGVVSYAVSALDGGGYRDPSRSNSIDVEGRVGAKFSDFQLGVGGYSGKRGEDGGRTPALRTARRVTMAAAYTPKAFRVGVEAFAAENWNNVVTVAGDRSRGYSVFGSYAFNDKVSAFARRDGVTPSRDLAPSRRETYLHLGAAYTPIRNVDVAMVYKRKTVERAALPKKAGDEVGIWGQVRF